MWRVFEELVVYYLDLCAAESMLSSASCSSCLLLSALVSWPSRRCSSFFAFLPLEISYGELCDVFTVPYKECYVVCWPFAV
jgi:hypothetical protein